MSHIEKLKKPKAPASAQPQQPFFKKKHAAHHAGEQLWHAPVSRSITIVQGKYGVFQIEHGLKTPPGNGLGSYYCKISLTPNALTAGSERIAFLQTAHRKRPHQTDAQARATEHNEGIRALMNDQAWFVDRQDPVGRKTPFIGMGKLAGQVGPVEEPDEDDNKQLKHTAQIGRYNGPERPPTDAYNIDEPSVEDPGSLEFVTTAMDMDTGQTFDAIKWGFRYDSDHQRFQETPITLLKSNDRLLKMRNEAIGIWNNKMAKPDNDIDPVPTHKPPQK